MYGPPMGPQPPQHQPQVVQVVATRSNVTAMIGFWMAVGSYLTCGVLGIPAMIVSAVGARQEPKGWAVAGIAVSIPSVLWSLFWVFTWLGFFTVAGIGAAAGASGAGQARADTIALQGLAKRHYLQHKVAGCPTVDELRDAGKLTATTKLVDPWGTPYRISCISDEVYAVSNGPDKMPKTDDDIAYP